LNCIITLTMSILGLGIVGLPQTFSEMGYIFAPLVVFVFTVITDISFCMLAIFCERIKSFSYDGLSRHYLGFWGVQATNWAFVLQLFVIFVAFLGIPMGTMETLIYQHSVGETQGTAVCKQLSGGFGDGGFSKPLCSINDPCKEATQKCIHYGLPTLRAFPQECPFDKIDPVNPECFCSEKKSFHRYIIGALITVYGIGMGLIPSLDGISPVTKLACLTFIAALVLYFIEFFSYVKEHGAADASAFPSKFSGAVSGLGNFILALNAQYQVVACQKEMKNRERIYLLSHITSFGLCLPIYLLVGLTGMFLFPEEEQAGNVFDALPSTKMSIAGKWLICAVVIMKVPIIVNACRDFIFDALASLPKLQLQKGKILHRLLVVSSIGVPGYFASWVLPLAAANSLNGALLLAPTAFLLPGMYGMVDANLYGVEGEGKKRYGWSSSFTAEGKKNYIVALSMTIIGLLSTIISFVGFIMLVTKDAVPFKVKDCPTPA